VNNVYSWKMFYYETQSYVLYRLKVYDWNLWNEIAMTDGEHIALRLLGAFINIFSWNVILWRELVVT